MTSKSKNLQTEKNGHQSTTRQACKQKVPKDRSPTPEKSGETTKRAKTSGFKRTAKNLGAGAAKLRENVGRNLQSHKSGSKLRKVDVVTSISSRNHGFKNNFNVKSEQADGTNRVSLLGRARFPEEKEGGGGRLHRQESFFHRVRKGQRCETHVPLIGHYTSEKKRGKKSSNFNGTRLDRRSSGHWGLQSRQEKGPDSLSWS